MAKKGTVIPYSKKNDIELIWHYHFTTVFGKKQ